MGWRAAQKIIHHWKILRGDNVMVTRDKDIGGTGVVKHVIRSQNHLIVEGENLLARKILPWIWRWKRHMTPKLGRACLIL